MIAFILGIALAGHPLISQSQKEVEARVQAHAQDASAHFTLCKIYNSLERFDDAVNQCQLAVQYAPKNSEYHDWLGRSYGAKAERASWMQAIGLAKKTRMEFEAAVDADPRNASALSDLGEFYTDAPSIVGGGKDKAQSIADRLWSVDRVDSLLLQAKIADNAKDKAKAEDLYRRAVAEASDPGQALCELSSFYRRVGDLQAMQQTADKIASLRNPGVHLYDAASMLVRAGKNLPGAIQMLQRYIDLGGSDEAPIYQALYQIGMAYKKQGDTERAHQQFAKALNIAPEFAPARKALGNS